MAINSFFFKLVDELSHTCSTGEQIHVYLRGEDSDFIRFNHNRIRQAGQVRQYELQLALVSGPRHCLGHCDLAGRMGRDRDTVKTLLGRLRRRLPDCPVDPYLHYNLEPRNTESDSTVKLPDAGSVAESIVAHADGLDLVGHYAAGEITRAFCNSLGQRNWHRRCLFNFDWSCHDRADKAVKARYAGDQWRESTLVNHLSAQRELLDVMRRPAKRLKPGRYRAYLAPAALAEVLFLMGWDGFSLRAMRTRQSPLLKLTDGECALNERITITEQRRAGFSPCFSDAGFVLPDSVDLIRCGRAAGCLVDARSSREYDQPVNAAAESPQALVLTPGELAMDKIVATLDTGLFISNLWYGNFSDRNNCRITGMTRYATLWVENGTIRAPLEVMRFDDSVYHMLGEKLIGLTLEREFIHDPHTYERRSLSSMHLPGALIEDFTLTL